jgi:hypothetical protein
MPTIEERLAAINEKIRERLEYAYDKSEYPGTKAWFRKVGYFEKIERDEKEKLRLVAEFIEKHGEHPAMFYAGPTGPTGPSY